jgi:exosortase
MGFEVHRFGCCRCGDGIRFPAVHVLKSRISMETIAQSAPKGEPSRRDRSSRRPDPVTIFLCLAAAVLFVALFQFYGVAHSVNDNTSLFTWTAAAWGNKDVYGGSVYWQGWVIPLVVGFLIWRQRKALAEVRLRTSWFGLVLVVAGLALHWAGLKSEQARISLMGMLLTLWAMPLFLGGWRLAWLLLFPVSLLMFCIPFYFLDVFVYPIRDFTMDVAARLLNAFELFGDNQGAEFSVGYENPVHFVVLDAYSSIHAALGISALTVIAGHLTQRTVLMQFLFLLLALPVAVVGNLTRILMVAVVGVSAGQAAADTALKFSGIIVYGVALLLLAGAARLLRPYEWRLPWLRGKEDAED